MHEAYLDGGVPKIEELFHARIIDAATLEAWRRDRRRPATTTRRSSTAATACCCSASSSTSLTGSTFRCSGATGPMGQAFTYLLTLAGAPSVPGAHSFPEQYPRAFAMRLPRAAISVRTPLANGNIAMFANRWKLIDDDTLPIILRSSATTRTRCASWWNLPVSRAREPLPAARAHRQDRRRCAHALGIRESRRRTGRRPGRGRRLACEAAAGRGDRRFGDRARSDLPAHARVAQLRHRHRQPGLDEPQPPAVRYRGGTARRARIPGPGGDGGDAQLDARRRSRPADSAAPVAGRPEPRGG